MYLVFFFLLLSLSLFLCPIFVLSSLFPTHPKFVRAVITGFLFPIPSLHHNPTCPSLPSPRTQAECPQLLDVEDMVRMREPDWKCVYTYIQEFYRCLVEKGLVKTKNATDAGGLRPTGGRGGHDGDGETSGCEMRLHLRPVPLQSPAASRASAAAGAPVALLLFRETPHPPPQKAGGAASPTLATPHLLVFWGLQQHPSRPPHRRLAIGNSGIPRTRQGRPAWEKGPEGLAANSAPRLLFIPRLFLIVASHSPLPSPDSPRDPRLPFPEAFNPEGHQIDVAEVRKDGLKQAKGGTLAFRICLGFPTSPKPGLIMDSRVVFFFSTLRTPFCHGEKSCKGGGTWERKRGEVALLTPPHPKLARLGLWGGSLLRLWQAVESRTFLGSQGTIEKRRGAF
ncbi:hypothetical protein E2320_012512 [Naja naja]|nr:hypothetical protein E2320_012512 [Naja naja]